MLIGKASTHGPASMRTGLYLVILALIHLKQISGNDTACSVNSPNFSKCLAIGLNKLIPTLNHGWTEGEIPGLDPIFLPDVNMSHVDKIMDITLTTDGVSITGLSNSRVHTVKTKKLSTGKMEVVLRAPELRVLGNYSTSGEVATFPLNSAGHFNITLSNTTVICNLYLETFNLEKEERFIVSALSLDVVPGQIYIKPSPYLDDDGKLGELFEEYLNKNSFELYILVKSPLLKYLSDVAMIMINSYLTQVPDNEIIGIR